MSVKLLTANHLELLTLKEAAQAHLSLHLSKYHIVGNHMLWINNVSIYTEKTSYYCKTLIFVFLFGTIGRRNKNRPKYKTAKTVSNSV